MKTHYGNYLGMVIDNNDPEYRGRVQVFVPHIMPTLYEGWNKDGKNITIECVGDNLPKGLTTEIVEKLKKILPWAEPASPIVGQSSPGGAIYSGAKKSESSGSLLYDQTPTAIPEGSLPPGSTCNLPVEGSHVDLKNLMPKFVQRLNGFYNEAISLGYKIICCSGFRSYEKQAALYAQVGSPGCARPGNSAHEYGIAVDLKVTGNGVSITQISTKQDSSNIDTPEFRSLLSKYGLHQPLHPINRPLGPEKWHIEPVETPKAGGPRGKEANARVSSLMAGSDAPNIPESISSSQFPPAGNPLITKTPSNTDLLTPTSPTTNHLPGAGVMSSGVFVGGSSTITSGPNSGSNANTTNVSKLAIDRISRFEPELSDPKLLDRIEYILNKEGGKSGHLIFETICNRAMFTNQTLKNTVFQRAYFHSSSDPSASATKPYTNYTLDIIKRVIYNGANETNLATDQAYNDQNLFAKKFIDSGATGDWFNLITGSKITNSSQIIKLTNNPGSGNEEFIYRKDGYGAARSTAGMRAKEYAAKYNIEPTTPSTFNSNAPLPEFLQEASKSALTQKPLNSSAANPPATVNKTDPHGPTVVKNTNDSAKGLFAFPGVGAMVWIFFREGNPQFPVYFAASYSAQEWKSAYNGAGLNPEGTNNGTVGSQLSNSLKMNPNAGGGLEFTHIKNVTDPSGASDKAVAMMYGDDGSNMLFSRGYHQIYTRHDRRDQIDGHLYNIIGGGEERWIEDDSSINVKGNVLIKIGKIDPESIEAMKELSDFSKQLNDTLMSNAGS